MKGKTMSTTHYEKNGVYYGYPQCCIDEFIRPVKETGKMASWKTRPKIQQDAAEHGFIPCQKHASRILSGKIKIHDIILPSRRHNDPFPEDGYFKYKPSSNRRVKCQAFPKVSDAGSKASMIPKR